MITLFTSPTPNGFRASIMLEETGLDYTVRAVSLQTGEHKTPAFLAVNATGRIPAIVDDAVGGAPFALSEIPASPTERALAYQWAATVISGFGAATTGIYFGRQLDEASHAKLIAKYFADIDVFLKAMDAHLEANAYLGGSEFSFADVLAFPTVALSLKNFKVDVEPYRAVVRWRDAVAARPAVQRGLGVPG